MYTVESVIDSSPNHTKYCSGRLRDPVHLTLITCCVFGLKAYQACASSKLCEFISVLVLMETKVV